jgi:ATP-dependent DNA helicase RecQ
VSLPTPAHILQQYWGYHAFRPLQEDIINSVLAGKDVLALLPTGGGKSVCYQVPALLVEGVTLVISPLIALMHDQVTRLHKLGIPSIALYSGMSNRELKTNLQNAVAGEYELLYVSPERLQTWLFQDYLEQMDIALLAVDEAHCISQWGHDFRPDYLKVKLVREIFPKVPILALTASATPDMQADVCHQLQLRHPQIFKQSFARPEVSCEVCYTENKPQVMLSSICLQQSTIVYCRSRKGTEIAQKTLQDNNINAVAYHAGMTAEVRLKAQEAWLSNQHQVIAATTAFGMGIDKPDVRLVLHLDAPEHLEAWYQEGGRAGRDRQPAKVVTLYNKTDIDRLLLSTELQYPPESYLRKVYQAVAEYLQLPIGSEPQRYYPFELAAFCQRFNLQQQQALYALKLLERQGLWTMTDSVYAPSTVQFIVNRHVLDELAEQNPKLGYFTIGLLRMFNSIFYYPTAVREWQVARQLKAGIDELVDALLLLDKMEIIHYNKASGGPQLFFHHQRADSRHLIIDMNRIAFLKQRHIARTEAMIAFLCSTDICRERYVLAYFGEQPTNDCGRCDVCRSKKQPTESFWRSEVLRLLAEEDTLNLINLVNHYPAHQKNGLLDALRQLADEGAILLQDGLIHKK